MKATVQPYLLAALLVALSAAALAHAQPTFVYETTVDGFYLSSGRGMAVDGEGNAYVIGSAYADHVHLDILVIKLGPDGTELWTTYIQGSGHDYATGVAVDNAGDVFVTGWTDSDDFPILNAIKETRTHRDAFVMKLSSEDGALLFSTYFGGSFSDHGGDIALNGDGEIYLVGYTESLDFPVTDDAIQDELNLLFGLPSDAFVTKLSPDAQTILYSTYLGGTTDDEGRSIGLDADGNIYVAGNTRSDDFPLADPVQPVHAGGFEDVFVARISANGSQLDYSTYLGGEDWDRVGRLVVDVAGNAYVAGSTRSMYFPTTPGAFQEEFVGEILGCEVPFGEDYNCEDVFVTKLTPDGSALAFSTYLGGSTVEECRDVAVDGEGSVYVVGYTSSEDYPPADDDPATGIIVSKLDASGSDLLYTVTVWSGSRNAGHGITVDDLGDVYFCGAINVPADVYVAKLSERPPGDLNGDGCVDQADLGILLASYGVDDGGDLDGDSDTDQADLGILLAHWGEDCP